MLKELLKDDGEYIVFNGHYLEVYIPSIYFESKLGENYGSDISVFGIFNLRAFNEKMQPMKLETLNFPSKLIIHPVEVETRVEKLLPSIEEEKYVVCKFYKGSKLMRNTIPKDSTNVELFVDLLIKAKIPRSIPYETLLLIWKKNLIINGVKLDVVASVLEAMIAEFYRDINRPERKFAKVIGKDPKVSQYAYKPVTIREICARSSTFAALTFEDMDTMITSSLNISKYKKKQTESPLEKILRM